MRPPFVSYSMGSINMKVTSQVLNRQPSYRSLLDATRWELDKNPVTRDWKQQQNSRLMPEFNRLAIAHEHCISHMYGSLYVRVFHPIMDFSPEDVKKQLDQLAELFPIWNVECIKAMARISTCYDYGLASLRVVTTAGVNFLTDAWQGTQNLSTLRYHGIGSGTNAEATGDTALQTEFTTQLTPASTRATGTLTEGASANIFRTVGSNVVNSSVTAAEHGIFNQAATGGGTLWDRSQFTGVGLVNGNTFQTTYDLTTAAGG